MSDIEQTNRVRPPLVLALADAGYRYQAFCHFRRLDWEVHLVVTGSEARRLARDVQPQVVVLQTDMAEESGWLTCAKLLLECPGQKVILVSADRTADSQRFADFVGATALVHTDEGIEVLFEKLMEVLPAADGVRQQGRRAKEKSAEDLTLRRMDVLLGKSLAISKNQSTMLVTYPYRRQGRFLADPSFSYRGTPSEGWPMDADSNSRTGIILDQVLHDPSDRQAWQRFVYHYGRRIYHWCLAYDVQAADAEDITQDVLLRFYQHFQTYDRARPFRNWLKTVTYNAWHDFVNKQKPNDRGAGGSAALEKIHSLEARDDLATRMGDAFDLELLELVQARVEREVDPAHWKCFLGMSRDRLSAGELGRQLRMSEQAVWQANSRVKKKIAHALQEIQELEESDAHNP